MSHPGDWKNYAAIIAPLGAAATIVAAGPFAAAAATASGVHPIAAMGANIAASLMASGLSALCKPRRLKAGEEHAEQLANHDIRRLVDTSWRAAACAAVERYVEIHSQDSAEPLGIKHPRPTEKFLKLLRGMREEHFDPKSTVGMIRASIQAARKSLLPDPDRPLLESQVVDDLTKALVSSITAALLRRYSGERDAEPPGDFIEFLTGRDERFPGGVLYDLCAYVSLHLKNDERAQKAILHFTLQDITESQERTEKRLDLIAESLAQQKSNLEGTGEKQTHIEASLEQVRAELQRLTAFLYEQNAPQRARYQAFDRQSQEDAQSIRLELDRAFNNFVRPQLDPPFQEVGGPFKRFTYMERHLHELIGRDEAMEALVDFLSDPNPGRWTAISGPAGSGKNRLAAELAERTTGGASAPEAAPIGVWRAGFLTQATWIASDGLKWEPDADALIIIDYADRIPEKDLASFLAALNRARQSRCLIRVLLIDRMPPDSDLGLATKFSRSDSGNKALATRWVPAESGADLAESTSAPGARYSSRFAARSEKTVRKDPLELGPVTGQSAVAIARAWAGSRWTQGTEDRVMIAFREDPELARPLFASLVGDAIATDGLPPGVLNPITVAAAALSRQFRILEEDPHWKKARDLFVVATMGQGAPESRLLKSAEAVIGERLSPGDLDELADQLHKVQGTAPGDFIPPLEPDFLAGLFVLDRLLKSKPIPTQRAEALAATAWDCGSAPAEFLIHLASDFFGREDQVARAATSGGTHPTREMANDVLMQLIFSATRPDALRRRGAEALAHAVWCASKAGAWGSARDLIESLENLKDWGPEWRRSLAKAWFNYALSGDLPYTARVNAVQALEEIRALARHDAGCSKTLAAALFNRTNQLIETKRSDEASELLAELRELHKASPDPDVRLQFARALVNRANLLVLTGRSDEAKGLLSKLQELHQEHPEAALAELLAAALANHGLRLGGGPDLLQEGRESLDKLRRLEILYPHASVRRWLATAISRVAGDGGPNSPEDADELLDELRDMHARTAEPFVRQSLANALSQRAIALGLSKEDQGEKVLRELRDLYQAYSEPVLLSIVGMTLWIGFHNLAIKQQGDEAGQLLHDLRDLSVAHPGPVVRTWLAIALADGAGFLTRAGQLMEAAELARELDNLDATYSDPQTHGQFEAALNTVGLGWAQNSSPENDDAVLRIFDNADPDLRRILAMGLFNLTTQFAMQAQSESAGELRLLRGLHERFPEPSVREWFAKALANVTIQLGDANATLIELRQLASDYPESVVRTALAHVLRFQVSHVVGFQRPADQQLRQELQDLTSTQPDPVARQTLEDMRFGDYHLSLQINADKLDDASALLSELRDLNAANPDTGVRDSFAKALVELAFNLGRATRFDAAKALLHEMHDLSKANPEPELRRQLAMGLNNLALTLADAGRPEEEGAVLNELRNLHASHPEPPVRAFFAAALCNRSRPGPQDGGAERTDGTLRELRDLYRSCPESAVGALLAKALTARIEHFRAIGRAEEAGEFLAELQQLHRDRPDAAIREWLARTLFHAVSDFIRGNRLDRARDLLREVRELHMAHPEHKVRAELAKALCNLAGPLGHLGRLSEASQLLEQLRELYVLYADSEIIGQLAVALLNRAIQLAAQQPDECTRPLRELFDLEKNHTTPELRTLLAQALAICLVRLEGAGQPVAVKSALAELREMCDACSGSDFRSVLAQELLKCAVNENKLRDADKILNQLKRLDGNGSEPVVRECLATFLAICVSSAAQSERSDDAVLLLSELRVLHKDHPEPAVRACLAGGLHNCSVGLAQVDKYLEALELCFELDDLYQAHPEPNVRLSLALSFKWSAALMVKLGQTAEVEREIRALTDLWEEFREPTVCRILKAAFQECGNMLIGGPHDELSRRYAALADKLEC